MSRYVNVIGYRAVLLRLAMWVALTLFAPLPVAEAANLADVGTIASRTDLLPYLGALETDKRDVSIERPGSIPGNKNFMTLRAKGAGPTFHWVAAGFTNSTTGVRDMVVAIADHGFVGSGLYWPKPLGGHVESITTAGAIKLQRLSVAGKEAYGFTLAPGQTGAIAFEIRGPSLSAVTLWQRNAFDDQKDYFAFFRGSLLGIAALLSIAMLALFGFRSRPVFLAASGFAVASVGFMLLEAGHLTAILEGLALPALTPAAGRAIVEGLMAVFLLLYLTTVLDLRRFVPTLDHALLLAGGLALAFAAGSFVDPAIASGVARTLFGVIALAGFLAIFFLWRQGDPKAETALLPWSAILLWSFTALVAVLASPRNIALSPALLAGLCGVLVIMVFALVHHAFSKGYLSQRFFREAGRRALALAGARAYVWDWQPEDVDLHVGEEIERALGLQPGLLAESGAETFLDIMHPADRSAYLAAVETAEQEGNGTIEHEFRLRHDDGDYRWFQLRGRGMPGSGDRAIRCIGTLTDVTDAKRSEERLLRNAVYDAVTGLPNRALFIDRVARALAADTDIRGIFVVLADIDRFKTVNDALGHEAGDSLLTVIARRLIAEVGPADTIGRLPGGQFAVLFQGQEHSASSLADSIRQAVARPVALDTEEVFLTASVGIAQNREPGLSAEQLLKDATIALYEAKRRGNGATEIFQPAMRDHRAELVVLEAELRRAIQRNEIEVHYQPIARLADMNLAGFEALVRWRHPVMGLLAPESFVELAEQTGLIKEIGRVVLNEAGRQLGIWQRSFRQAEPVFVAVNMSPSQLVEPGLIEDVTQVLRREAVGGDSLKIEVTESLVMQYPELARYVLEHLKELGVGLCCDDFGTGHSSLSSLRKLPFDTLKIDRAFIAAEPMDNRATVILEAIVAMAHALGLSIVAEGIENQEQVDRLGALECDWGQGYFIGRPMTAKQVTDALAGLPYTASGGRTALTWLWERAAKDPVPEPATVEVTSASIHERQIPHAIDRKIKREATVPPDRGEDAAGLSEVKMEPVVQPSATEPETPVSTIEPEEVKPSTPPLGAAPRAPRVPKHIEPIAVEAESSALEEGVAKSKNEEPPKVRKRRRRRIPDDAAKRAVKKLQSTQH